MSDQTTINDSTEIGTSSSEPVLIEQQDSRLISSERARDYSTPYSTWFLLLPVLYLIVTLLGGMRLSADNAFIFLKPPLICLVLAVVSLLILTRVGLIRIDGWIANDFSLLHNAASVSVFLTLFTATVQVFNSLLPEQGLAFWVVGFCFIWTLVNNLFSSFDVKRLMRSLGVLFGMAFMTKYIVLANLAAPAGGTWLNRVLENPGRETFTWLLDLPPFGPGTGYIQFFTIVFYLLALYLTPASLRK